jgi:hypothetical protein
MQYKSISPNLLQHKNACLPIALATIFPDKMIQVKSEKDGYSFGQMYNFGVECEVLITPCSPKMDWANLISVYREKLDENSVMMFFIGYNHLNKKEQHFTALVFSKQRWALVDVASMHQIKIGSFEHEKTNLVRLLLSDFYQLHTVAVWSEQGKIKQAPTTQFSHLFDE